MEKILKRLERNNERTNKGEEIMKYVEYKLNEPRKIVFSRDFWLFR